MTQHYIIRGLWVGTESQDFFGVPYRKFQAELPSMDSAGRIASATVFLPKGLEGKERPCKDDPRLKELELVPGTYLIQLVPYTTVIGVPSASRQSNLCHEDLRPENEPIKMLAIPAS